MWKRKEGMEGRMGKKIPKVNGRADGKNNTKSEKQERNLTEILPGWVKGLTTLYKTPVY